MYVYILSPCLRQQASFITAKKTKIKNKQTTPQKQNPKKTTPKLSNWNPVEQNGLQNVV